MNQQAIFEAIRQKEEKLCVLATATKDNRPECAVVGYAAKEDGTIIINTNRHTRKVGNIRQNNSVALAVGWNFGYRNFQYEGKAEIIEKDNPDFRSLEEFFFGQNPNAKKFQSPDTIFICIKPTWVRMLDLTVDPVVTKEFSINGNE